MRMSRIVPIVLSAAVLPTAGAGLAREKKPDDPNRLICEKQEVLGSRLATKRVCKTAAEWAADKQSNRESIDRTQIQRVTTGGN